MTGFCPCQRMGKNCHLINVLEALMSDVKWIKITTDVFDNWKIKQIRAIPDMGHALLCVWFELLCMAGSCNAGGLIVMSNKIVATDEIIANIFNEDVKLIRIALKTFEEFGMIEVLEDSAIHIKNWDEYQSVKGLAEIREYERERKARYRENQKQKRLSETNVPDKSLEVSIDNSIDMSEDPSISISSSNSKEKQYQGLHENAKEQIFYLVKNVYPRSEDITSAERSWIKILRASPDPAEMADKIFKATQAYLEDFHRRGLQDKYLKTYAYWLDNTMPLWIDVGGAS